VILDSSVIVTVAMQKQGDEDLVSKMRSADTLVGDDFPRTDIEVA